MPINKYKTIKAADNICRIIFFWSIFILSIIPFGFMIMKDFTENRKFFKEKTETLYSLSKWYIENVPPVQELRPLAKSPIPWEGNWLATEKNYFRFEKWFSDHLGFRDLMIRTKNEIDYQLFRSSSRVYFGKDNDIYGRNLIDKELPATEHILNTEENIEDIHRGLYEYTERIKKIGIKTIFITPLQKPNFYPERLPFHAPILPLDTNFKKLYRKLQSDPRINFIDVYGILDSLRNKFPIFYKQDFHWTNMAALSVAENTVNKIAKIEGVGNKWRYPIAIEYLPFLGSDARFSARLNAKDQVLEPQLVKTWKDARSMKVLNEKSTGFEFETEESNDTDLLPAACMYGNSFSDGMLVAGLADYFKKFTKIDRTLPLNDLDKLIAGRCKYLIIQILDIQTGHWLSFKK